MIDGAEYFRTSKGPRHRSQVYSVEGGSHVRRSEAVPQIRAREGLTWSTLAKPAPDAQDQGGWVSWADWQDATQNPILSFAAAWQVPPEPKQANGQLVYLFNGLQDANGRHILQPVLQWGLSPAQGSGNAWGLASFWVGQSTDPMFCTQWVAVAPGTVVTGRMTVIAQANGLFSCTCAFDGFPGTSLTAENLPALVDAVLTLEAYGISSMAPYPGISATEFTAVKLNLATSADATAWTTNGGATVKPDGSVDVAYPAAVA